MATLYKANGETAQVRPKNGTDFKLEELRAIIGCKWIEVARLTGYAKSDFFVVDEEGKLNGKPFNAKATEIYCRYHPDYIVGDALLCSYKEVK